MKSKRKHEEEEKQLPIPELLTRFKDLSVVRLFTTAGVGVNVCNVVANLVKRVQLDR